jgi:hypothetical protein
MCHFYNWQDAPFDTRYPDWMGYGDAAVGQLDALAEAGIPVLPYVNARLWDTTTESWRETGRKVALQKLQGGPEIETYPTCSVELAVACPSQSAYHSKVIEVCQSLADSRFEYPGIYLDQLGAAFGLRCYADDHGHAAGGARSWNAGQRRMVAKLRSVLVEKMACEPILMCENASEPLVDLIDGFLYYCGRRDEPLGRAVPLWHVIYGDRATMLCDYYDRDLDLVDGKPSPNMLGRIARQAIFGNCLGWLSPHFLTGAYESVATLIRNARSARLPILEFFRTGLLCSDSLDSTSEITGVFQSAWRRNGEQVGLAVNPTDHVVEFAWPDDSKDTLEPFSARHRRLA